MASVATALVVNLLEVMEVMEMEVAINLRQKLRTFIGTATVITILHLARYHSKTDQTPALY